VNVANPWLLILPLAGISWWLLGFPPGWGWLVIPVIPTMPVTIGMLVTLATVVIGAYAGVAWLRNNI
jgi:hypothetical protein